MISTLILMHVRDHTFETELLLEFVLLLVSLTNELRAQQFLFHDDDQVDGG